MIRSGEATTPPAIEESTLTVAIVTDSTACIPPQVVQRYGIEVVPVHIIFGGRTFADAMLPDDEFYALLRSSRERPTTAAPSPGMFLDAIARAARRADSVLCITVSAQFSAMYDAARQAIAMLMSESPDADIRIIDSRNAAMAQGFVVIEAARLAHAGASIEDVMARAQDMTARVTLLAMLDTLEFLARGGRVPRVAAWAAGLLQMKPIVRFSASDIKLAARTRTRRRALERIAAMTVDAAHGRRIHLAVHHADAEALRDRLVGALNVEESFVTEFTQVMGVHTGPGLTGVAFWTE
ncbi:MAG: DegV family protein [Dehalococcoidia bacterium]